MSQLKEQSATLVTAAVVGLAAAAVIAIEGSLAGEAFLFVDGCFIALVWGTARWTTRWTEGSEAPPGQWTDPYLLGYLAGGASHAIHTATLALVDRGLLHAESNRLTLAVPNAADLVGETDRARDRRRGGRSAAGAGGLPVSGGQAGLRSVPREARERGSDPRIEANRPPCAAGGDRRRRYRDRGCDALRAGVVPRVAQVRLSGDHDDRGRRGHSHRRVR